MAIGSVSPKSEHGRRSRTLETIRTITSDAGGVPFPKRSVIATVLVVLAWMMVFVFELRANATDVDFSAPDPPNYCYYQLMIRSHKFCAAHWTVNPMLGPSGHTLLHFGGVASHKVSNTGQYWRLFVAVFMHAGVIQLFLNVIVLMTVGFLLERAHGMFRFALMFLISGMFGGFSTVLIFPGVVTVSSSSAVIGVVGAAIADLVFNWDIQRDACVSLLLISIGLIFELLIGTMPFFDNFAHIFSIAMGFFSALLLLDRLNRTQGCMQKCSRGVIRIVAGVVVLAAFAIAVALVQGFFSFIGISAAGICPECDVATCREFPWGCNTACFWTCDSARVFSGVCKGEAVWTSPEEQAGYVDINCSRIGDGVGANMSNVTTVRVDGMNLTHWGPQMLSEVCKDSCPGE